MFIYIALILGLAVCTIRRKDSQKKMLQMFPDDDIRETIINYADGAGEENTVFSALRLLIFDFFVVVIIVFFALKRLFFYQLLQIFLTKNPI